MLIRFAMKSVLLAPRFSPMVVQNMVNHLENCPVNTSRKRRPMCPTGSKTSGYDPPGVANIPPIKRALQSGPVRMGFIPEEWFQFFHSKTGVSGPYFLMLGVANYLVSKEIYVMEHEYYSGISIFIMVYYATTRIGPKIASSLDKQIDAISEEFQKSRDHELAAQEIIIKDSNEAIWRAEGQKLLMDAKKENIALQLEAAYRERLMMVYHGVRGCMDYHVKKNIAVVRIHQKWMIQWILDQVTKSITPEFQKQALESAISDLARLSSAKK